MFDLLSWVPLCYWPWLLHSSEKTSCSLMAALLLLLCTRLPASNGKWQTIRHCLSIAMIRKCRSAQGFTDVASIVCEETNGARFVTFTHDIHSVTSFYDAIKTSQALELLLTTGEQVMT